MSGNGEWRIPLTDLKNMRRRTGEIVTRLLNILHSAATPYLCKTIYNQFTQVIKGINSI
jgi:hypothetical protein